MKIDESCIDHNALRLIRDYVGIPLEYCTSDDEADHMRLVTLGYVQGVIEMAKAMKEVLSV